MEGDASFAHGFTFAGHPVASAVAMANLDIFEREDLCGHVLAKEGEFREMLESAARHPDRRRRARRRLLPRDRAGQGPETKESFSDEESEGLLRGFLSGELYERGLICRADDRGDPVVQLAPPLIADTEQFEEIHDVLHAVLDRGVGAGPEIGARMLTVQSLLDELGLDARRRRPSAPTRRSAGSTSPSSRTRRRGSPAAS